jgi:hypothetical protein
MLTNFCRSRASRRRHITPHFTLRFPAMSTLQVLHDTSCHGRSRASSVHHPLHWAAHQPSRRRPTPTLKPQPPGRFLHSHPLGAWTPSKSTKTKETKTALLRSKKFVNGWIKEVVTCVANRAALGWLALRRANCLHRGFLCLPFRCTRTWTGGDIHHATWNDGPLRCHQTDRVFL